MKICLSQLFRLQKWIVSIVIRLRYRRILFSSRMFSSEVDIGWWKEICFAKKKKKRSESRFWFTISFNAILNRIGLRMNLHRAVVNNGIHIKRIQISLGKWERKFAKESDLWNCEACKIEKSSISICFKMFSSN